MIVLQSNPSLDAKCKRIVLIFGLGLIGKEIFNSLLAQSYTYTTHKFDWNDRGQQAQDASTLMAEIKTIVACEAYDKAVEVAVVWAAGRAGFSSGDNEMATEELSFKAILDVYRKLVDACPSGKFKFHLVSSAGGIFESQSHIGAESTPSPCRPYGHLKLKLEMLLSEVLDKDSCFIYRPSSVYGLLNSGRSGLISTLIKNGLLNKEVQIFGSMDTLRDYVFSGDIGEYIANKITKKPDNYGTHFLVSGRPTSILQLKITVERILNKKIYICSSLSGSNSENITFNHSCLPYDWRPTEINLGVKKIYSEYFLQDHY